MIRNLGQVAAIYIGSSAPRNTNLIWLDNTVVPFVFRAYDGSAWSEIATHKWVRAYVDGWLVTLPPRQLADDGDYMLINSNNVNYKITVKDFVKSAVGNPLDFKGVIRVSADFPNPSTLGSGDMYVIITSPAGGTVTDPYSGKTFEDSEKIVWDEVTQSWESLGKIDITVDLTTSYSETEVTIHSSAGKETTIQGATDQLAGVMLPGQYSWLQALSNGSIVPGDPSPLTPLTPAHKHNYSDIINRLVSQQETGESTIDPMSQKATTDALNLKFDKASVLQVSGAATDKVMSQKAVTDALKTLSDDFNNKLTNYLPLAGGTMKGSIRFPAESGIIGNADGTGDTYILRSFNNRLDIGSAALSTRIISNASDLLHHRSDTSYKIWDAYNLPTPASTTDLANYLPLSGGTMTGSINLGNTPLLASISQGIATLLSINNTNNIETLSFGNTALDLNIYSSNKDLIHYRYTTPYKIWDSYNLSKPTVYNGGAIGTPTTIYDRNLSVNGTGWTFLSATNAPTTSIFAPTTVGTKGYYLVSSGTGAPVWQQLEDLGDGKYLPLIGGTLTGQVTIQQNVDIKLRLQSTDTDNYCIIQAINAQASQLGVFGYAGDKWAIGHSGTYYEIWDKYNLSDPATKSGNNSFTGTNSFVGGKFSVAGSESEVYVSAVGNLVTRSTYGTTGWLRSLEFSDNDVVVARFGVNATTKNNVPTTNFVGILVGNGSVNDSQYKFGTNKLTVPESWSLDDPNGNALVWSQSSTLAHLGRASGTTKIRSGNVNLIHTKGTTDYTILDSSNYTEFLPQNIAWTYGFVSHAVNNDGYDANSMIGVDKPKLLFNYYTPGKIVNAPTGMGYGNVLQIDGPYTSSHNEAALKTQLAFDIIHNVDNGTGRMWYRTANNKGMAVANWRRVLTADENIAGLSFDGNNYPAIIRVDGTTYPWLRANGNGFLPNVEKSLASGGASQLGSSSWAFLAGYIASVYTNKLVFGVTGPYMIASTNAFQFLDSAGGVHKVAAGSLYVGPSYASDALSLVPTNGIYSKGIIYIENGIGFRNSIWTNDLTPNRNYSGYLQVLDAYDAANAGGPTNYGTVLQINSRNSHWANQLWFPGGDEASKNGLYYRHMAYNQTEYSDWQKILTNKDVNIIPTQSASNPSSLPVNQIFYSEIHGVTGTPTTKGLLFSAQGDDEGIQLWADSTRVELYYRIKWASYGNWIKLATTSDLNSYLTKTEASTLYYPYNGRGYLSITSTGKPVMSNNQGYAVKDKDGNEREVLWMGTDNTLHLGNTSQYTLNILNLRCVTLTHNGNPIATQNYVTNQLANYLPLTGGTLSGNLTINTVGSTTLVINNNDTNGSETFMRVLRKGTASAAIGFRDSLGAYIYNYNSNKYLFIDNDGYARVGTTSGSTRLALITDIPTVSGYLPLTGGTLTGTLSINSGGSEPLIINNSASTGEAYVVTKTQGTTRGVMGWNSSLGMFLQDNRGYTFSVKADGVYFGASSSTLTKLPTSTDLSNYLPLTGGNLTGKLSIKSSGSNLLILDSSSSTESVIHFLRSSTTKGAVGYYDNIGAFIYNFPSNTYLFVKDDGKPYVGTRTNYKKILTETDITGYATQSWVNNQGYLTSHQTIYNLTFQAGTFAAKTFDPNGAAATVNIPTNTSHLTNDSGFITSSALNGYATQAWVNSQNFVKSTSTKKVTDIQPVDALPATQVSGVLYLVFG